MIGWMLAVVFLLIATIIYISSSFYKQEYKRVSFELSELKSKIHMESEDVRKSLPSIEGVYNEEDT